MEKLTISRSLQLQFDRHKEMSGDTLTEILQLIKLVDFDLENYLYGLFDGYDYSTEIRSLLGTTSGEVRERLEELLVEISKYEKY